MRSVYGEADALTRCGHVRLSRLLYVRDRDFETQIHLLAMSLRMTVSLGKRLGGMSTRRGDSFGFDKSLLPSTAVTVKQDCKHGGWHMYASKRREDYVTGAGATIRAVGG